MVSRIIKLVSSEPSEWPLFPHRTSKSDIRFDRNVAKNISSFPTRGLVLVLVLIKDHFFIKRMLTQKASIYPGFILMPVATS